MNFLDEILAPNSLHILTGYSETGKKYKLIIINFMIRLLCIFALVWILLTLNLQGKVASEFPIVTIFKIVHI